MGKKADNVINILQVIDNQRRCTDANILQRKKIHVLHGDKVKVLIAYLHTFCQLLNNKADSFLYKIVIDSKADFPLGEFVRANSSENKYSVM